MAEEGTSDCPNAVFLFVPDVPIADHYKVQLATSIFMSSIKRVAGNYVFLSFFLSLSLSLSLALCLYPSGRHLVSPVGPREQDKDTPIFAPLRAQDSGHADRCCSPGSAQ